MRFAALFGIVIGASGVLGATSETDRQRVVQVWIDSRFSNHEREEVRRGIEIWNDAMRGQMVFYVASENVPHPGWNATIALSNTIVRGITIDRETRCPYDHYLAWTGAVGSRDIHVLPDRIPGNGCPDVSMRWIVAHEIGHSLGIQHVESRSLMAAPCGEMSTCVDSITLDWAAHHQGIERSRMSPGCSP